LPVTKSALPSPFQSPVTMALGLVPVPVARLLALFQVPAVAALCCR
jgi:hypothetical protein